MAYPSEHAFCSHGALRLVMVLVGLCLVGYIVRSPLYTTRSSSAQGSCPCSCDCSEESVFSLPLGSLNGSYADCGKDDPAMNEEMEKNTVSLLSEELNLRKIVANETMERTKASIADARKGSSQYQKEAEKCNAGMETCEAARESAEKELIEEFKLSALWERRAQQLGWKDVGRVNT
ncbi:hypothetical protein HS088_TW11G00660 [Tripterygium wilfordii]|uniref:Uncharacterized protein n=1 Tax=Tripterygium wilfordii TaxID=458696 RepID=A0A7J7D3E3_TRIWF|nr:uncharacterized protein LOC120009294 [Tripterygium wilfordii]KAF5740586.1 hypothetical protein HS088_TW11G00660 [Tripterygium wilfordii]